MALNFPDNPTTGQLYTDSTAGFTYEWDGVVWKSYTASASKNISIVDNIEGSFNGSTQTFALAVSGVSLTPANAQQLRVVLGGIVQEPITNYTVSGPNITFITAPIAGLDCSIVSLGPAVPVSVPGDGTVTPAKLSTGGPSWNTSGDVTITGTGTTALLVNGNARVTGILTVGTSSITLDGINDRIIVGSAVTLTSGGINVVGVVTATSFVGNGSGLTGAGSTVADDTTTNATFYPLFTQTTSGTVTASKVSTTKLSFNPSTGGLSVTSLNGSLANTLTLNTSGTGLSGSTTYNNSGVSTFTVTSNATSANTVSTIVARDASGNFSAGTITAALTGNSSTASTLQTARNINGISFNGSANIEVNPSTGAYSNGFGARTVSTSTPTGGSDGDIWYQY